MYNYSILDILQVSAKSVISLARNHRCHGSHGHDGTNFDKIAKMKGKTTIYRNETCYSTTVPIMLFVTSKPSDLWLIVFWGP
jgi:hypothetical protein